MKQILIFLFLLIACPAWGANCGGVTVCACGDTITSNYTMPDNLSCTGGGGTEQALIIGANDLTIDMNGKTLSSDRSYSIGIYSYDKTGTILKNGTVSNFLTSCVDFSGSSTATVNDMTATLSGNQGFQNAETAVVVYNRVTSNDNVDDGISLHTNAQVTVNTGSFDGNAQGIHGINSTKLTAYNITVTNSGTQDIKNDTDQEWLIDGINFTGLIDANYGTTILRNAVGTGTPSVRTGYTGKLFAYGAKITSTLTTPLINNAGSTSECWIIGWYINSHAGYIYYGTGAGSGYLIGNYIGTNTGSNHLVATTTNSNGNLLAAYNTFVSIPSAKNAIAVYAGSGAVRIFNNLFWSSVTNKAAQVSRGMQLNDDTEFRNNIFMNLDVAITNNAGSHTYSHNLYYNNDSNGITPEATALTVDPLFISSTNFHLQPGSPARGAGVNVGLSNTNPPDIGAEPYVQYVPWR
jgi:hypothetical protein